MTTPLFKQYFGGGSTGIRAFRARALGPGAYTPDTASINLIGYQNFADIRMEFNTELRLKFTNIINGAVFMDAGNIWSFGSPERAAYDSSAIISKDFIKQIAVARHWLTPRLFVSDLPVGYCDAVPQALVYQRNRIRNGQRAL